MGQNGREESLCHGMCNDIFCRSPPTIPTTPRLVIGHKKGKNSSQEIHGQKSESGREQDGQSDGRPALVSASSASNQRQAF